MTYCKVCGRQAIRRCNDHICDGLDYGPQWDKEFSEIVNMILGTVITVTFFYAIYLHSKGII